ncbi:MAG: gamma-glutamyl-gamma-aminobutyrate hydrolase family protein [Bacteroidaceae bacterium]|nr:gamma-glutamyl-gamma-aminobutyrate hydrolase family protein [Bacteroidaceae bacterium]
MKVIAFIAILCGVWGLAHLLHPRDCTEAATHDVKIAIAWRADTDNEFCTNVVEAFRAAGVEVVVLPQVKASYLIYDGERVTGSCLDSAGVGYLSETTGATIRAKGYEDSNVAEVMASVQGVVFTGGEDISSTLYATPQDWHHVENEIDFNPARDVSDYLTMAYCLDRNIPVLGLCRGAQMLGVVSGATMIQDIPTWFASHDLPYNYEHRCEKTGGETYRDYAPHDVTLTDGSLPARFFGTTKLTACPSWHHQSILSTEGTPLRVVGTTSVSGVEMTEAVERTDKRCAIGLQFHPEAAVAKHLGKGVNNANAARFMPYDTALPFFRAFIEECKQ